MCGIAGIIGSKASEKSINQMLKATRHRGPDDYGIASFEGAAIGMNRLAIIDLSALAHQPMLSKDGRYAIVYNGEIYNYLEIRKELEKQGEFFQSNSDTEVLLRAFLVYGKACLSKIRGMFAFVIWDKETQTAFGARDHLGIKPFIYSVKDNNLIFCSELKGFLALNSYNWIPDDSSVAEYLMRGYITAPSTILKDIYSLLPGNCFEFKNGELTISTYWDLKENELPALPEKEMLSTIKQHVLDAVKEQQVSDVPLGVFLSGGLDSSIVVSAMRESGIKKIKTFSIGLQNDSTELDESSDARITSAFFQTDHYEFMLTGEEITSKFHHYYKMLDQPSVDGLNTYLVSEMARKEVTVALSGLGGDELFGGYSWQTKPYLTSANKKTAANILNPIKNFLPDSLSNKVKSTLLMNDMHDYYKNLHTTFSENEWDTVPNSPIKKESILDKALSAYQLKVADKMRQITYYDMKVFMASRLLRDNDAVAMGHSLEVRFPFIDYRLCEFAWNIKTEQKRDGFSADPGYGNGTKKLLYEAFRNQLPPDIATRKKKGFKLPYQLWFKTTLRHEVDLIWTSPYLSKFIRKEKLVEIKHGWEHGKVNWVIILQLLTLDGWFRYVYERTP